jgi:branched-chain amino acid transport system ATP-binding protein
VDIWVDEHEALAVVGPNGAGKTSVVHALLGLVPLATGTIEFAGRDLGVLPAHARAEAGIALVPAGRWLFLPLTVQQNIDLGRMFRRTGGLTDDEVFDSFPELAQRRSAQAGTLSGGQQQMLALARALVGRPRLLILDEPSLGLAPLVVERLYAKLAELKAAGTAVVVVEERTQFALELCDRYVAMSGGRIVASGEATGSADEAATIARTYLGGVA